MANLYSSIHQFPQLLCVITPFCHGSEK